MHPRDLERHRCVNYFSARNGKISNWDYNRDGERIEQFRVTKILAFRGLTQTAIDVAEAGDIVTIAGMSFGARDKSMVVSLRVEQ